ncbi:Cyclohexadienyl dehydratase precursor [Pseudodesulfovibrio hydrargyri]|uniref:Cyclohexadienyl dehydratase n=1 Tax=Pseudodesulfovibrio hydrargyri TaxID=2125990 RepID=A0A1J5NDZ7_9BACT|nr:transporter substrate-binding domain-containing protein [Pseudodesulfovibrio hydrargyri]OIQ49929.1 Cyclohexadienyl dehydratase precursor [Pseudodesulfovibrio hydrargyri]
MSKTYCALLVCCMLFLTVSESRARGFDEIVASGTLKVGTTGDYKPFSFDNNGTYEGFDIAVARSFADRLGLKLELVKTTWKTLMADLKADRYDIGMSGITRTIARQKEARFSQGYVMFGKTILVNKDNAARFGSLADVDQKGVKIGVNPGGTNEKFVKANIKNAEVVVFESNLAIPPAVADKKVDVMITDSVEALYYAATDAKLAAPLADEPFTRAELGYLMPASAERLQDTVDFMMDQMILKGEMAELKTQYLHMAE